MQRQPDPEGGSLADVAFQFDAAAMLAHDSLHDHQPEAGSLFLGGVKRLKDAVDLFLRNSAAGVAPRSPKRRRGFAGLQGEIAALGHRLQWRF